MDPVNLLVGINLFVSMSANYGGAKKGLKTSITKVIDRPVTYLQKLPPNISALILVLIIAGIFKIGSFTGNLEKEYGTLRLIGLCMFVVFSWMQVFAYKSLGNNYAPDIVIMKDHKLFTSGIYKFIRHPQYISQILSDLGAGLALLGYIVIPLVILVELPLFIMRAQYEEKLLGKFFKEDFLNYKKRSGFFIPFIG